MIFIFILLFGVLFLFVNIRQVAPGNRGSIAAGLAVIALPVCFIFRGHLWACVGQAFLSVWLCEALLLYIFWWLFRGIRRLAVRRPLPRQISIIGARALLAVSVVVSAVMCVAGYFHNADYYLRRAEVDLPGDSHFTALFFSDLHLDPLFDRDKALRILHDADSVRPDFIFFGGDLSDEHDSLMTLEGYDAIFREMAGKARLGAFAVDGNHEAYMERSGSDPHGWLRRNGWIVLEDSTACTELVCITGRVDHQVARVRSGEGYTCAADCAGPPAPRPRFARYAQARLCAFGTHARRAVFPGDGHHQLGVANCLRLWRAGRYQVACDERCAQLGPPGARGQRRRDVDFEL